MRITLFSSLVSTPFSYPLSLPTLLVVTECGALLWLLCDEMALAVWLAAVRYFLGFEVVI